MRDCCKSCKRNFKLIKFDYTQGGCKHTEVEGFVCSAFAAEGKAVWMIGVDLENGICEEFLLKDELDA